ncbi:agmatine deiminase [Duganella sp. CF458]|uniref:agmatine deiminase family protein n=1 Tax=Duganella sp. CF458 TaxID=1884368 RepID=UPI0008E550DD|nr:agmatine deiminase family protein [Duganella sp. CF458]SFF60970.1 agmatine deiminase [Duganella sp. CF458]
MTNRRTFLHLGGIGLVGGLISACGGGADHTAGGDGTTVAPQPKPDTANWQMPDEGSPQRAVWMAFVAQESIWGTQLQLPVQQALARIANAIAVHHPVKMLVNPEDLGAARQLCGANVQLIEHAVDDLWMRDTGCVFVRDGRNAHNTHEKRAALSFNFNGWGNKQAHTRDATVAARMAALSNVPLLRSKLILEGGGIEVDGQGTAIITESCVLNANRNPGVSKADAELELKRLLGLEKIIWLPGIAGRDITDGHTDFYARFIKPGVVVAALDNDSKSFDYTVTRQHLDLLRSASDARGRPLQLITLETPKQVRPAYAGKDFAAGYVNFLLTDKALFLPEFGDAAADQAARNALAAQLPGHQIVQLNIDAIAAGGGGIHCTTQQEPV